ncbi:MAG TPA: chemotaxis protein CheA [Sunxiuqinia sp.]|nr:chemotaxis protein CheA [Sunxiuqinia sp.]
MERFQKRFIDEALEYFENLESVLLNLKEDHDNQQAVNEVFRIMHSLKGSGAMFGFDLLSEVTHQLESLYELIRNGRMSLNAVIVSHTLNAIDQLRRLLVLNPGGEEKDLARTILHQTVSLVEQEETRGGVLQHEESPVVQTEGEEPEKSYLIYFKPSPDVAANGTNPLYLIDELCLLGKSAVKVDFSKLPDYENYDVRTCYLGWRVVLVTSESLETLQEVFLFVQDDSEIKIIELQDGDLLDHDDRIEQCFSLPLKEVSTYISRQVREEQEAQTKTAEVAPETRTEMVSGLQLRTIRVNASKIDEYMNLVSELIIAQSQLELMAERNKDLEPVQEQFSKVIRQLRDNAFDMSLIPLNNLATRFKRLVHDLSGELHKEVELVTEGLETEVDKNIIEKLAEPLLHIIRNCIDHGIELPDERLTGGKTRAGVIIIKASYVGAFVEINITDDGRGLDVERIRQKAIQKALITSESEWNESALISLIFEPGFSTSEHLSDVSGRGIGMDIVRNRIKDLRGDIEVDTKRGEGTSFTIRLPLTLSIIDGLLTRVNDDLYVIPTAIIEKIYPLTLEERKNKLRQVVVFEDREIPYIDLRKEFAPNSSEMKQQYLIAVTYKNSLFGVVVDDVLREYQAVVKPLGNVMGQHDMFLGASILGDGKVTLVIDMKKIIQKFSA